MKGKQVPKVPRVSKTKHGKTHGKPVPKVPRVKKG